MVTKKARLIFDDGTIFPGKVFALSGDRYAEVVFNTAMTGYQEILTDPSYSEQMVVMTYPIIGSYGINPEDIESRKIFLEALIVKEYMPFTSNWRSHKTLQRYLEENNILGVEGMDTRAITRYLRQFGAKKAVLTSSDAPIESLLVKLNTSHNIAGINISKFASCEKPFQWEKPDEVRFRVAVLDCGIKYNILRLLHSHGCECTIFPSNTHVEQILKGRFDGMFLSNGPGDPGPIVDVVDTISQVLGKLPFFGICLGHQLLGQALGIRTYKLRFGHHGANHPIKNLRTGRVEITSQNHNYALSLNNINEKDVEVTHVNLNDNTIAGIRHKQFPAFSVQYHPEASPGPHDSRYLFDNFIKMMQEHKNKQPV